MDVNNVNGFISTIRIRASGTNAQNRTGAAYIVNTMMGVNGASANRPPSSAMLDQWEERVRAYDALGRVDWDERMTFPTGYINTYYQNSGNDVAHYRSTAVESRYSIVFRNADNSARYIIKKNCGNPMGEPSALQDLTRSWNYVHSSFNTSPSSATSATYPRRAHGTSVTVSSTIRNNGDGRGGSYQLRIQRRVGSGSWSTIGSTISEGALNAGISRGPRTRTFTLPSNVANDTLVCFRARIQPFSGRSEPGYTVTSSDWRNSTTRCMRVFTPLQDFSVSATCSTISITNLRDGVTPINVRIRVISSTGATTTVHNGTLAHGSHSFSYPNNRKNHLNHTVEVVTTSNIGQTRTRNASVGACFAATCSSLGFNNEPIIAGSNYSINAAFRNTGGLAWNSTNNVRAVFTGTNGTRPGPTGNISLARNTTTNRSFSGFSANNTLNTHSVQMRLQYRNSSGSWVNVTGANCSNSFDPWTNFTITPVNRGREFDPNAENPDTFTYESAATVSYSPVASAPAVNGPRATRIIERVRGGTTETLFTNNSFTGGYTSSAPEFSDSVSTDNFQVGDRYCARLSIDRTTGLINRNGDVVNLGGGTSTVADYCQTIVDQPYLAAFGADAVAGNGYGETCSSATPGIITAFYDSGENRGSGTQFAALAMATIEGFASSRMNDPPSNLSFANTTGGYGGGLLQPQCSTDYFAQIPSDVSDVGGDSITNAHINNSGTYLFASDARVTSAASANRINSGIKVGVYVEGDVQILNNITYRNDSWSSLDDIPSFFLIATGDIYIDASVDQLDGVYVSQGGTIYTCTDRDNPYDEEGMFDNCINKLTVNGSLIANFIKFNRYANSSLRFGSQDEYPYSGVDDNPCADGVERTICAAEVINFSPELYLAPPQLRPTSTPGQSRYDAITSLPPVL